ncbi:MULTISPECIES: hypothetical protein [Cyanophyceae]|uniref:Uncharacterized protein n=1 Tax=Leptolyngbya subtilissima DQ-A4 TaxID=2933933 RepID=A0ABV0K8T0_9CYAN|nr:hypothetical protein [Nodosilinea sp. FACHB-141]MBD2110344.1 hypothetical protein [Nodosilinea sp. FACHB-141]
MPRRPSASSSDGSSKNKPRVRFIFEPDRTSPNGITYFWLIHDTYNGKEKAATATRAFWLPFAYRHSGNYSEAELRDLAQQSIWQMEAQIQHLREEFELGLVRPDATELVGATEAENLQPETISGSALVQPMTVAAPADLLDEFTDAL